MNEIREISNLFKEFKKLHILVIGDLILDKYIWGEVSRISPEAPVPVIRVKNKENRLGGASNVAANLISLGAETTLAGIVGNDQDGNIFSELLDEKGIHQIIVRTAERNTIVKSRVLAQNQQLMRIDEEETGQIDRDTQEDIVNRIEKNITKFDGIIISDYMKGLLDREIIQKVLTLAGDRKIVIDPKGHDYKKYRGATAIKPNFKEFRFALHQPDLQKDDIPEFALEMVDDLDLDGIVITMGEDGAFVLDDKKRDYRISTKVKEVYDVSGAGDTFIAAFTAGLVLTDDWHKAARAGNVASGIAVGKVGTAAVTLDEVLNNKNLKIS